MSVLNKYNQRVIAILGTITIVALSILIIILALIAVEDFIATRPQPSSVSGITLDTENAQEGDTISRDQAITFRKPVRIDSTRQLYIIPVSQVKLEEPEKVQKRIQFDYSRKLNVDAPYSDSNLNNLLIYDAKTNESYPVFSRKTLVDEYKVVTVNNRTYLLISAAHEDSNQNGVLNTADLQSLYIYDVLNKRLKQYEPPGKGLWRFGQLYETSNITAQYYTDKNKDGMIDYDTEPASLFIISLLNFEAKEMVDPMLVERLQGIVD